MSEQGWSERKRTRLKEAKGQGQYVDTVRFKSGEKVEWPGMKVEVDRGRWLTLEQINPFHGVLLSGSASALSFICIGSGLSLEIECD